MFSSFEAQIIANQKQAEAIKTAQAYHLASMAKGSGRSNFANVHATVIAFIRSFIQKFEGNRMQGPTSVVETNASCVS